MMPCVALCPSRGWMTVAATLMAATGEASCTSLPKSKVRGEMHVVNILGGGVLSHAVVLSRWMTALGLSPSQRVAETEMTRIRVVEAHMELTTRAPALYVTAAQTAKIVSLFRVDKDNPDSRVDVVCTLFARIVSHQVFLCCGRCCN